MATEATILQFPVKRTRAQRLVPLSELMDQFGASDRWWRYRIAEGLPVHRWGRRLRFDTDEVEAWLDNYYEMKVGSR